MMLRLMGVPEGSGLKAEWLAFIHQCNEIEPGIFGEPESSGPWWAGGYVEEYADARLVLTQDEDRTARLASKTERGERVMRQAAQAMGIKTNEENRG